VAAAQADAVAEATRVGAPGTQVVLAPDGDLYEAQVSGTSLTGYGVRRESGGERYRGQLADGVGSGVGVYEFAANPADALRYEGDHVADVADGLGVTYWRNGNVYAGEEQAGAKTGRGVISFADGQRYEGQVRDGVQHGLGVIWGPDGRLVWAGRWENGRLVEPRAVD
jgi:hypothetical protein